MFVLNLIIELFKWMAMAIGSVVMALCTLGFIVGLIDKYATKSGGKQEVDKGEAPREKHQSRDHLSN